MNNGTGLRVVVWFSYCKFHCKNCFNVETQDKNYGDEFTEEQINYIKEYLNKDWCSGITFSGGDPMWQSSEDIESLIELCNYTHSIIKDVWIWTGFTFEEIMQYGKSNEELSNEELARRKLLSCCDILVDGRYVDEQRDLTLKWRGSSNQRVIDVPDSLKRKQVVLLRREN